SIKVIDFDLNFLGEVDDYKSAYFTRCWHRAGDFQINVDNLRHAAYLKVDNIVFINANKPYIIESIDINLDAATMIVKGRELKSILDRRITYPPLGLAYDYINSNSESIMKGYVDKNAISVTQNRIIANIQIAQNLNRGISTVYQTRYKNLLDELESLSLLSSLGYGIKLDLDGKKFIFDIYVGIDRKASQVVNSRAIFCKDYDNIITQNYKEDQKNYKNYAIIGGQGEEENRQIIEVEEDVLNTGIKRKEVFIDARDSSENTTLEERGRAKLSEFYKVITLDTKVSEYPLVYEVDYDLGDIVTILEKSIGLTLDTRIIEITENYDRTGFSINPVFGSNIPTFNSVFRSIKNNVQETIKEVISATEPSSIAVGDYWLQTL
ncbi:MAG: siphovirus ReqiPepy6 Gp37-like family protein, partial [Eubacteriaceae bacterium]